MKRQNRRDEIRQQQQQQQIRADLGPHMRAVAAIDPDSKMSEALFNLSLTDRNEINEELHGVSCRAPEETPELLQESLANFELELNKIESKPAYNRSCELLVSNPSGRLESYIHNKYFKLRFLRCELFVACKAAKRYTKYLDLILELHGEKALNRPIRMSDLNREEMSVLREGQYQILPLRDRSGRRIVCLPTNSMKEVPRRVLLKVYLYIWDSLLGVGVFTNNDMDHLETQHKGAIGILIPSFQFYNEREIEGKLSWFVTRVKVNELIMSATPIRIVGLHLCFPSNPLSRAMTALSTMLLSSRLPVTKINFGNPLELRYTLQGYGIPVELIPSTDTGNIKSANLKQWIKLRKYLEWEVQRREMNFYSSESESASDYESQVSYSTTPNYIVECPGSKDVIFRRGKSMNYHPGNVKFLNLIELNIQEHTIDSETTQKRRSEIEKEIIREVRDGGGRFLTWEVENCWWVDMSKGNYKGTWEIDQEIQKKVHYAFRDFQKKLLKVTINNCATYAFERQDGQKRKRHKFDGTETSGGCQVGNECLSGGFNSSHAMNFDL